MIRKLAAFLAVAATLALTGCGYNDLQRQDEGIKAAWSEVLNQYQRRADLIPNLVETVKGYAAHERGTLDEVTRARAAAMAPNQSPSQAAQSEGELSRALVNLQAVSEAYPDLKANQNFMSLQNELSATEDRIASARRYYNANVRALNTKVETLPTNFIAGMAGVTKAEYFETEGIAREAPQVSFDTNGPATPSVGQGPAAGGQLPPGPQDTPPPQG
jgi:LemA protein